MHSTVYICVYLNVYIYIYIHLCTYVGTHTNTHTYAQVRFLKMMFKQTWLKKVFQMFHSWPIFSDSSHIMRFNGEVQYMGHAFYVKSNS